jgi:hypothetical protein
MPAALNSMSGTTPASHIFPKHALRAFESATSHSKTLKSRPRVRTALSSRGPAGSLGSWMDTISAPASAKVVQSSFPSPPVTPVQMAVLPSMEKRRLTGRWTGGFTAVVEEVLYGHEAPLCEAVLSEIAGVSCNGTQRCCKDTKDRQYAALLACRGRRSGVRDLNNDILIMECEYARE